MKKPIIGLIGQGFIGGNLADDFEERGFVVIRYSLEKKYIKNKDLIKNCDIVFIAVPTPTTPKGFSDSTLRKVIKLVGDGKIAVIKSTIIPGTTKSIQKENTRIFVLHSPEFLREKTAKEDTRRPERNLIGTPLNTRTYKQKADLVLSVLPKSSYNQILDSSETELVKYIGNNFLFTKVVFMNIMYDFSKKLGVNWSRVVDAVTHDSRIGNSHMIPVHPSGVSKKPGRGAGGHCFIKDFEAFLREYRKISEDSLGLIVLETLRDKNNRLLVSSKKDLDLLKDVYGERF